VRLVIYGQPLRAPKVLHNEKVTARLGKGVAESGDLSPKAMALALASLARFKAILGLQGVTEVDVVATAASRDAGNGPAFLEAIAKLGLTPRLLSGEEEAITSAHGVLVPSRAKGVVGDLGGGSLELVDVDGGAAPMASACRWARCACPRLRAQGQRAFGQKITKALAKAEWKATPGQTLYLVGGSLRALPAMSWCRPSFRSTIPMAMSPIRPWRSSWPRRWRGARARRSGRSRAFPAGASPACPIPPRCSPC
jgi:exopolyphosphatase/guanosine-5'-triphosphate,3'-diphosphate pyrophosphatase